MAPRMSLRVLVGTKDFQVSVHDGPQAGLDWMETMTENATGSVSHLAANTYVVSGNSETKPLQDLPRDPPGTRPGRVNGDRRRFENH